MAEAEVKKPARPRARKEKPPAPAPAPAPPGAEDAALRKYKEKRRFDSTPEPTGGEAVPVTEVRRFCVQKHAARRLHYDLRLELGGVLKSWAVTRGPSIDPADKRLAVETEDHPLDYLQFEGVIPEGQYGAGSMIVWDQGEWEPAYDPEWALEKGHLEFTLKGERLSGRWHLVKMKPRPREKNVNWLLIKAEDEAAKPGGGEGWADAQPTSILSGRTNKQLEKEGAVRADHAARAAVKALDLRPGIVAGAKLGILPPFVEPQLATLADKAPSGDRWFHEIKFDGYRILARVDGGKVRMLTRKGLDWTPQFAALAERLKSLPVKAAMIDGEAVVEDEAGVSSFVALQDALSAGKSERMRFFAFDLLYLDGWDLTGAALSERKRLLAEVLAPLPKGGAIRFSEHIVGDGEAMARHACRLGLEGIVSKRADLPYRAGRGQNWLKKKCTDRQEVVIVGYVPSSVSSKAVGALALGVYEEGTLTYVGRVGTGFTERVARELWEALDPLRRDKPAFAGTLPGEVTKGVRWVEPQLVAEIEFRGWTGDGYARQAAFKGLRADKEPADVIREGKVPGRTSAAPPAPKFRLTHADRVLWPDTGLTKEGLAGFYSEIADYILPHIAGRPLSLMRCPEGISAACFYQKHAWNGMSAAVKRHQVGDDEVLVISDLEGIGALVQASVLEIHPWGSILETAELPDRMILDLDPGDGTSLDLLVEATLVVKKRVEDMGLVPFVKTTGGKGFHVVVPLKPEADWDAVKDFAHVIAKDLARDDPERFTANMSKEKRQGRVYLDWLRNARGATAVAPYSTRARPGAPVSTPLAWDELTPAMKPNHFTVENLPTRLRYLGADPWAALDASARPLPVLAPEARPKRRAPRPSTGSGGRWAKKTD